MILNMEQINPTSIPGNQLAINHNITPAPNLQYPRVNNVNNNKERHTLTNP